MLARRRRRTLAILSMAAILYTPPLGIQAAESCHESASRPPLVAAMTLGLPPLNLALRKEAIDLGRRLFFDRRLSANGTLSCGMCHIPEQGFAQNELATPVGIEGRSVRRNAPSLYNVAYVPALFHDGREASLELQIWGPLLAANEMGNVDRAEVVSKVQSTDDYAEQFAELYSDGVTARSIGDALASYQRTLLSADSPFDRWYFHGEADAVTTQAQRGYAIFASRGCSECHSVGNEAARFTDDDFHNTGIGYRADRSPRRVSRVQLAPGFTVALDVVIDIPRIPDAGRFEVTQRAADRWRYRTPTLRNVALTGPFMHDGSVASLTAVVEYYDAGGSGDPEQDARVRPLELSTEDKQALVAFLEALTGSNVQALTADARSVAVGERGAVRLRSTEPCASDPTTGHRPAGPES